MSDYNINRIMLWEIKSNSYFQNKISSQLWYKCHQIALNIENYINSKIVIVKNYYKTNKFFKNLWCN